jgi:hypothetical protein
MLQEAALAVQETEEFLQVFLLALLESPPLHSKELLVVEHEVHHQTQHHHNLLDYALR